MVHGRRNIFGLFDEEHGPLGGYGITLALITGTIMPAGTFFATRR